MEEEDFEGFLQNATVAEIVWYLNKLTGTAEAVGRQRLQRVLLERTNLDAITKQFLVNYAATLTLAYGEEGVRQLARLAVEAARRPYPSAILKAIYYASCECHVPLGLSSVSVTHLLRSPKITGDMAVLARSLFQDLIVQSQRNADLFRQFVTFIWQEINTSNDQQLMNLFFNTIRESSLVLSHAIIAEFETLIASDLKEEIYQRFLSANPVLLDPLARRVISKQQLGIEMITDFVVARLDNEYILVEIEKPQDRIFTQGDDFTQRFSHALGQVLGFQEWVESNIAYARELLPEIIAPVGLLVIGRRSELSEWQQKKLNRFNINNSGRVRVLCFDDLLGSAIKLRRNLHPGP